MTWDAEHVILHKALLALRTMSDERNGNDRDDAMEEDEERRVRAICPPARARANRAPCRARQAERGASLTPRFPPSVPQPRRDRSESPGRGRSGSRSPPPPPRERRNYSDEEEDDRPRRAEEVMDVDSNDAAFILGRGGQTKQKISRVSGADLDLNERDNKITIYGTRRQRKAARDYIGYIMMQRTGEVHIDLEEDRDDITVVKVPEDCVAFCMGRGGQTLRTMEQEWGSLMFFAKSSAGSNDGKEMLMIFGPLRARRGAEMKVMSAIEHKKPGTFVRDGELFMQKRVVGDQAEGSWDVDWMILEGDEFSYALGAGGSTRKKLAAASGCVLEYVGNMACFCGYKRERRRAKDYLKWLLKQRHGPVTVDYEERDDVTIVRVPQGSVGFITGHRGESLRSIERETNTFCFINEASKGGKEEELLIFGDSDIARWPPSLHPSPSESTPST